MRARQPNPDLFIRGKGVHRNRQFQTARQEPKQIPDKQFFDGGRPFIEDWYAWREFCREPEGRPVDEDDVPVPIPIPTIERDI